MPEIKPFKGILPSLEWVNWTVLDKNQVPTSDFNNQEGNNPYSFFHVLEQAKPQPNQKPDYPKAFENLQIFLQEKVFIQDEKECFYLYTVNFKNREQNGLIAAVSTEDYRSGKIKIHEKTRVEREKHLSSFIETLGSDTTPVMLAYRHSPALDHTFHEIKQNPALFRIRLNSDVEFEIRRIDNINHIQTLSTTFNQMDAFYIADGHHRAKSVSNLSINNPSFSHFSAILFPDNELKIFPFYRLIHKSCGVTYTEALSKLNGSFHISEINLDMMYYQFLPDYHFILCTEHHSFLLSPRNEYKDSINTSNPLEVLDVNRLQEDVLAPFFGIQNPTSDPNIEFGTQSISLNSFKNLLKLETTECILLSKAPSMEQIFAVADHGLTMPPKSTSFEPKIKSGLVLYKH